MSGSTRAKSAPRLLVSSCIFLAISLYPPQEVNVIFKLFFSVFMRARRKQVEMNSPRPLQVPGKEVRKEDQKNLEHQDSEKHL